MTAPTTRATPKIALDQRAASRHDNAVDDDVAAIGEVEERVREHRGRLGGRVALKAAAGGPRPGLLARGFVAPRR